MIGIDIGANTIKIVEVNKEQNLLVLGAIGETKNPNSKWLAADNKQKASEEVAGAVKTLLWDLKIKEKQVVATLPEEEVVSRLIRLPPLKESEIRDALKFEAETFIPYPLDQVSIDYEIIEQDDAGRLTVFVIAARNDLIQAYVKLFKSIGLELAALESPSVALCRVIKNTIITNNEAIEGVLTMDIGEKYSDLVGINKGNIIFTRTMSVGGESITRAISVNLGLDMASAEEYKKAYGMREMELEGKIKNAILPVFSSMAEELRKALAAYTEQQGRPIDLLVLSGGGANLPGLAEELTKLLGVEVVVIQPFIHIDSTRLVLPLNLNADGCRYSLSVGSAIRGSL